LNTGQHEVVKLPVQLNFVLTRNTCNNVRVTNTFTLDEDNQRNAIESLLKRVFDLFCPTSFSLMIEIYKDNRQACHLLCQNLLKVHKNYSWQSFRMCEQCSREEM